jgi:hypothetical protein
VWWWAWVNDLEGPRTEHSMTTPPQLTASSKAPSNISPATPHLQSKKATFLPLVGMVLVVWFGACGLCGVRANVERVVSVVKQNRSLAATAATMAAMPPTHALRPSPPSPPSPPPPPQPQGRARHGGATAAEAARAKVVVGTHKKSRGRKQARARRSKTRGDQLDGQTHRRPPPRHTMLPSLIQQLEKRFGGRLADLVRPKPIITASSLQREHLDEVTYGSSKGSVKKTLGAPNHNTHSPIHPY